MEAEEHQNGDRDHVDRTEDGSEEIKRRMWGAGAVNARGLEYRKGHKCKCDKK
jgi:hypothetical protein